MLHNSVLNKDKNHYYFNVFLEKCLYQLAKKLTKEKFAAKKTYKILGC